MSAIVVDNQGVERVLNWEPSPPDLRDFQFHEHMPEEVLGLLAAPALPDFVDIDSGFPNPVTDQGATGECTAHGSLNDLEFVLKLLGFIVSQYSHKAQYFLTRQEGGLPTSQDTGAYVRDTVKVLTNIGAVLLSMHPDTTDFRQAPSTLAIADASKRRSLKYVSVPVGVNEIKATLAGGLPVIIGFRVPQAFMGVGRDGLVPADMTLIPNAGHCVIVVGYDDRVGSPTFGRFKIRNSWGEGWGASGRGWILYAWLMALGADFWSITDAVGEGKVVPPEPPTPPPPPPPPVPTPTSVQFSRQPVDSKVGDTVVCTFVVRDQQGGPLFQPVRVTPVGNLRYGGATITPAENGLCTYQVAFGLPHPATEHFHLEVAAGTLVANSAEFVVSPKDTPAPPPPPPPPPVGPRKAVKILYDDGSVQSI